MKIGLFFGSFSPIHIGHLIIAQHFTQFSDVEKVWFVVSPQNPFKEKANLMDAHDRLNMVKLCTHENALFEACDIEFSLPTPSYTIHTLGAISKKYPENNFVLIMGSDNFQEIDKWKDSQKILNDYDIYLYSRRGSEPDLNYPRVKLFSSPFLDISSTYIRECLKHGKSVKYLVPEKALEYMQQKILGVSQ